MGFKIFRISEDKNGLMKNKVFPVGVKNPTLKENLFEISATIKW
jgi:hypothetical protein